MISKESLRRVASGELSVEDAEPLIAAASHRESAADQGTVPGSRPFAPPRPPAPPSAPRPPQAPSAPAGDADASGTGARRESGGPARRIVRLQVMEGGRSVVNLRIPMGWAGIAGSVLPGLSNEHAERLRDAIRSGTVGRILEVQDEDGDGVIISTE